MSEDACKDAGNDVQGATDKYPAGGKHLAAKREGDPCRLTPRILIHINMESTREAWFPIVSVPLYAILIGTEILLSNWQGENSTPSGEHCRTYTSLINAGIDLAPSLGIPTLAYHVVLQPPFCKSIEHAFAWFLLFILEDLAFYFEHRIDHYCRIWAVLSPIIRQKSRLTTGFRSSVFQHRELYFIPPCWAST